MADEEKQEGRPPEPRGLGEHARGLASEYAHEQGWQLNEEQRKKQPDGRQDFYGGKGFDYGPQDFGDTAVKTDEGEPMPLPASPDVEDKKAS